MVDFWLGLRNTIPKALPRASAVSVKQRQGRDRPRGALHHDGSLLDFFRAMTCLSLKFLHFPINFRNFTSYYVILPSNHGPLSPLKSLDGKNWLLQPAVVSSICFFSQPAAHTSCPFGLIGNGNLLWVSRLNQIAGTPKENMYIWLWVKIVYGTFRGVPDVWNEGAS